MFGKGHPLKEHTCLPRKVEVGDTLYFYNLRSGDYPRKVVVQSHGQMDPCHRHREGGGLVFTLTGHTFSICGGTVHFYDLLILLQITMCTKKV